MKDFISNIDFKFWTSIIFGPLITIVAIFISNWMGRKSTDRDYQIKTLERSYENYYVPLMKVLISANKEHLTYYWIIAGWYAAPKPVRNQNDFLKNLMHSNLEYIPPQIVNYIPSYTSKTSEAALFFGEGGYKENYRDNLIEASDLFDKIIELSLREASSVANKLGYPDISKPILESFLSVEETKYNYPRYLPEIYQIMQPRHFVGEEPPYY